MTHLDLPVTDRELVDACAAELSAAAEAASTSGDAEVDAAQLRFAWALAHSADEADVHRACEMLSSWLESNAGNKERREPLYLLSVAHWRAGNVLEARRWAEAALAVSPSCHQSLALKTACEEQLAEDALIAGVGIAGVGVLALGVVAALLAGGRRGR